MAIGNAPWPIGVTMVGIHARTGREKIFARNVAHVLNDETQRKYIQVCLFLSVESRLICYIFITTLVVIDKYYTVNALGQVVLLFNI